jgi:glycine dehydrogenase subunit 1
MYEFQSFVCELTGMEVANAGMYDGATALAEAALMACRVTGRHCVSVLETVNPLYQEVLRTYLVPQGIGVEHLLPQDGAMAQESACLIVQQLNFFGCLEDLQGLSGQAHDKGALLVASVDPISLGMFAPPGQFGADIVTAEGQSLGISLSFGGPYVGLFACRMQHLRQMPGRLVGRTVDANGRDGFVLTLQTREQHIRRERATSNICTTETLMALAATVYLAAVGKQGLRQVAELCYHKAHYAAQAIAKLKGFHVPFLERPFFKEFLVECPAPPSVINRRLLRRRILGGLDVSQHWPKGWLLCVTEMNTKEEIDRLVEALKEFQA